MIYDGENIFFKDQDLSKGTASDVIANAGGGDAVMAPWITASTLEALSADAVLTLTTSDKENMSGAVTLGTLSLEKEEGSHAAMRIPKGAKAFLKLTVAGATTGKIRAAIVLDD